MTLAYLRNKHAGTTVLEDGSLLIKTVMNDTFFSGTAEIVISVPDLEIVSVHGEIRRCFNPKCLEAVPLLQKAVGLRMGPGLIKSVNGLVGGAEGCPRLADLILECCDQVVLHFTLQQIQKLQQAGVEQDLLEVGRGVLKGNPGLIGSCIAFAEDSPLLEVFKE